MNQSLRSMRPRLTPPVPGFLKLSPKLAISAHWEADDEKRPMIVEWQTDRQTGGGGFLPLRQHELRSRGRGGAACRCRRQNPDSQLVTKSGPDWPVKIPGLWVVKEKTNSPLKGYEVTLNLPASVETPAVASTVAKITLLEALGLAFLGGLLLNIMPCVLPVIALKILGFVSQAKESPARVRMLGSDLWPGSFGFLSGAGGCGDCHPTRRGAWQAGVPRSRTRNSA